MFNTPSGEKNLKSFCKKEAYERDKHKGWGFLDNL